MRLTFQLLAKHCEEDCEIDGTRSLLQHLVQLFLFHVETSCCGTQTRQVVNVLKPKRSAKKKKKNPHILTQSSKSVPQIILVNEAISVLVHDSEGLQQQRQAVIPHISERMLLIGEAYLYFISTLSPRI